MISETFLLWHHLNSSLVVMYINMYVRLKCIQEEKISQIT